MDGSRPSLEAARQAAILAGGAALSYVAVPWEIGVGATAQATLGHWRAAEGLRKARDTARQLGLAPALIEDAAPQPAAKLMELAAGHDLLVVGIHGRTRAGGILGVGGTASVLVHRSPVPVLVARRAAEGVEFPRDVLLAVDGEEESHRATTVAARIARRHGARVAIVAAPDLDARRRHALAADAAEIVEATGTEPVVLDEHGPPHQAVASAAADLRASLIVTGSRGLSGLPALRSVSERVAHAAPCSVLVVRPPAAE